jgi:ADP-ribosylglycohydrolase
MTERFMRIRAVRRQGGGAIVEGTDEILGAGAAIDAAGLVGAEAILLRRDATDEKARITSVSMAPGSSGERVLLVTVDRAVGDVVVGGTLRLDSAAFDAAVQRAPAARQTRLAIAAAQAAERGLPAVGFSFDMASTVMSAGAFPGPGCYARASGPPGGTLLFEVHASVSDDEGAVGADDALGATFAELGRSPFELGSSAAIEAAGGKREALGVVTGAGAQRVAWAALVVRAPAGALLIVGGVGLGPRDTASVELVAGHPQLAPLFRSLSIDGVTGSPGRVLAAARTSGAIGEPAREASGGPDGESLSFPPGRVDVAGWPETLTGAASLPRAIGALLGLAVGDALGTTNEFRAMDAPRFPALATGPVDDIVGQGPFHLAPGQVTDDTQMAAALADHFWKLNLFTSGTVAVRYLAWMGAAFDVGVQIRQALDLVGGGTSPERAGRLVWEERRRFPAGNGSLMRTAVIGVLLAGKPEARRQAALLDSAITHFDPRCQLACAAFDAAIAHALTARPSPASMLRAARDELGEAAALLRSRHADLAGEIDAAAAALAADLDAAREDDPGLRDRELHIHETAGFVRVAFRLAFWELLHAPDFRAGVVDVANRGGDADTNAAIAGALLGAFHGVGGIPAGWVERVLAAPGVVAEEWDFHPRVFLRALSKGFGAQRDVRALAALAPFIAAGFPEYGPTPRPADAVSLATPSLPLRPGVALPLLVDLLDHAGRTPGFEHVTPEHVLLVGDGATLRVASIAAVTSRSPDELARLPRAWLVAPPEIVAGQAAAPAVSATFTACALWLHALRRHGPYAPGEGQPALAPVELPAVIAQPIADAVRAALRSDPAKRVPASVIHSLIRMSGQVRT